MRLQVCYTFGLSKEHLQKTFQAIRCGVTHLRQETPFKLRTCAHAQCETISHSRWHKPIVNIFKIRRKVFSRVTSYVTVNLPRFVNGKIDALVSLLVLQLVRLLLRAFPHRETSASIERQHEGGTTGRRPQTASFPMKRVDRTDSELCWTWDPRQGFGLVWNSLFCKERSCCPLTFWSWRVFWFSGRGSLRVFVCIGGHLDVNATFQVRHARLLHVTLNKPRFLAFIMYLFLIWFSCQESAVSVLAACLLHIILRYQLGVA